MRRDKGNKSVGDKSVKTGPAKTAVLPGFHAWSGADITGSFTGKVMISIGYLDR